MGTKRFQAKIAKKDLNPTIPVIEFELEVGKSGDVHLIGRDSETTKYLVTICADTGRLKRLEFAELEGLDFDGVGRINLTGENG